MKAFLYFHEYSTNSTMTPNMSVTFKTLSF